MAAKSCREIGALVTANNLMDVLKYARTPLGVSELARMTGFSVDTVFRQMGTQENLRWVERIGEGYILGFYHADCWTKRKAQVETKIIDAQRELAELTN